MKRKIQAKTKMIGTIRKFLNTSAPFFPVILFVCVIVSLFMKKWEFTLGLFALFLTSLTIYHNTQTRVTQFLTDCYREIKELENQYYQKYEDDSQKGKMAWRALFLNTLEFQSFLFNREYLPKEEFLEFFCDVIKWGHNKVLPQRNEDMKDKSKFPELKHLYLTYFQENPKVPKKER